jgi:outer membrane murein-binding lipoprotein Lpp
MKLATPLGGLGLAALLGAAVGLAGCQGAGQFAQVSEKLNQVSDNQKQILSRLDGLEAKIEEAAKRAPAAAPGQQKQAGPQPGQPDPAATYKVAVAPTDQSKGPADALVTLVEWSDFQ